MEWPFSRVRKIFFRGRNSRKIPEIPQKERFLESLEPNLRLQIVKIQSLNKFNSIRPAIPYPYLTPPTLFVKCRFPHLAPDNGRDGGVGFGGGGWLPFPASGLLIAKNSRKKNPLASKKMKPDVFPGPESC